MADQSVLSAAEGAFGEFRDGPFFEFVADFPVVLALPELGPQEELPRAHEGDDREDEDGHDLRAFGNFEGGCHVTCGCRGG